MNPRQLSRAIKQRLILAFIRLLTTHQRRVLTWWFMAETGIEGFTFRRNGIVWNAPSNDHIAQDLYNFGAYQGREIDALLGWMRRSGRLTSSRDVVVDAGANIGTTCVPMVLKAGCRALAIEPVEKNFGLLRRNVEANGLSQKILLTRKAIARIPGPLKMCLASWASGGHFVAKGGEATLREDLIAGFEEVESNTLSGIVAESSLRADQIALVWADVQGCEMEVIESGAPLWQSGVPLWAEVEPVSLRRQGVYEEFADSAAAHFDRFVVSRELISLEDKAPVRAIGKFRAFLDAITPQQVNEDVLFLPPSFR